MTSEQTDETLQAQEEITSLSQFMDWVQRQQQSVIQNVEDAQEFFYRGHADESYQLQPTAYRKNAEGKSFREVEYQLYQEMLRHNTEIFAEDKTTFERLVRMQHYGLPTRLLDVTQSALVALYFACEGESAKNVDGEVILFVQPQSDVLLSSAVSEASMTGLDVLLNLEKIGAFIKAKFRIFYEGYFSTVLKQQFFNEDLIYCLSSITNNFKKIKEAEDFLEIMDVVEHFENNIDNFQNLTNKLFSESHQINLASEISQDLLEISNKQHVLHSALQLGNHFKGFRDHQITEICKQLNFNKYYDYLRLSIFLSTFCSYHFVFPALNNERIRRQLGAFLLFPVIKSKNNPLKYFRKPVRVKIPATTKLIIRGELAHLGITQSYLFPEPENQAKEIARKYPER